MRKWECGPVVVPNERDYAVAKDAECGSGKTEGKKVRRSEGEKEYTEQRTVEPQNNEPQNVEGWFRFAQSF